MRLFENNNPIDMNIPYKLGKFLFNITTEALAGRLGKQGGSFDWKNEKGWELPISEWEPLVPTHGNFAGPGYSCGKRGEFSPQEIRDYPVTRTYDPKLGKMRPDYVDMLAQEHDLAYAEARGQPDYWEQIRKADTELITGTQKLLNGTSPLFSDGGKMTPSETAYAESMLDGFKLKLVMMDEPAAAFEKLKNSGYGTQQINDLFNTLSQGLQFKNPRDLLRDLHLSENEIQGIEQETAAYCQETGLDAGSILTASIPGTELNTLQTASAASPDPDDYPDEDQDYYRGPGMGMG